MKKIKIEINSYIPENHIDDIVIDFLTPDEMVLTGFMHLNDLKKIWFTNKRLFIYDPLSKTYTSIANSTIINFQVKESDKFVEWCLLWDKGVVNITYSVDKNLRETKKAIRLFSKHIY